MCASQCDQLLHEQTQRRTFRRCCPVQPAQSVVLAVDVVVALVCIAVFVTGQQHGHPLRQQQGGKQVALLALAQRQDGGVVGWPLDAAVPRQVVAVAVAVVFAVGQIVFVVV